MNEEQNNNMQEVNIHKTIYDLKLLLSETQALKLEEMPIHLSKVFAFIYGNQALKDYIIYNLKKSKTKNFKQKRDNVLIILNYILETNTNSQIICHNFDEYIKNIFNILDDNKKNLFKNKIEKNNLSLVDVFLTLAFILNDNKVRIPKDKVQSFDDFKKIQFTIAVNYLEIAAIFTTNNNFELYLIKIYLKYILSELIILLFQNRKDINYTQEEIFNNYNFTDREKELAIHLSKRNYKRKELAEKMTIDETTVQTYINNIAEKLGVRGKTEINELLSKNN